MLSLARFPYRFTFRLKFFILTVVAVWILGSLGMWQLHRAAVKQRILELQSNQSKQAPISLPTNEKISQYQKVIVKGRFLNDKQFLLDNQHHEHQFGYNVLTPLLLANGQVVLIDRGWVRGDVTRRQLPVIKSVDGELVIRGNAYYPSKKGFILGDVINNPGHWPQVVEKIDLKLISKTLHKPVIGFIIRQNPQQAHGFIRQWSIVSMPPAKHKAYALQWFSMALLVIILFIGLNLERK